MKTKQSIISFENMKVWVTLLLFVFISGVAAAADSYPRSQPEDNQNYKTFKGEVRDSESGDPLVFATLAIDGTNIATVSNSDGEFILKVPEDQLNKNITISYIGYKNKQVPVSSLKPERNKIELDVLAVSLSEIKVFPTDPDLLIRTVMYKKKDNYVEEPLEMTAFYRETIKKGWSYVSLAEAVVDVYKQPYTSARADKVRLFKGRKSTDYSKLDTLVFKLQGGPYTNLLMDIMKNPYIIFTDDMVGNYEFNLASVTRIDKKLVYVLEFKPRPGAIDALFYGKLFIDTESLAITSATFNMDTSDELKAADILIKRKPIGAKVYPTEAAYMVNYREKNGKWYFGYSRGQVTFKINWDKKLFNSHYVSTIEMAVTDWQKTEDKPFRSSDRMKMNVIMSDAVSGFSDPEFWGKYNVIEPEKSIDQAIRKIQRKLRRN